MFSHFFPTFIGLFRVYLKTSLYLRYSISWFKKMSEKSACTTYFVSSQNYHFTSILFVFSLNDCSIKYFVLANLSYLGSSAIS